VAVVGMGWDVCVGGGGDRCSGRSLWDTILRRVLRRGGL
jgi:hypothetical protein